MTFALQTSKHDTFTAKGGTTRGPAYDWAVVARSLGAKVHPAWPEAAFCAFRADNGKGPVPKGVVIPATMDRDAQGKAVPGTGSQWVTVCEHGTMYRTDTGKAAHQVNGPARDQWCEACAKGEPGVVPLLTAVSTPQAVTAPTPPAPADKTAPAPADSKAPAAPKK